MSGIRVIDLTAARSFYELGLHQGQACAAEIRRATDLALAALGPGRTILSQKLAGCTRMIARHAPHILEELQGIARGAGVALPALLTLNCLDECYCALLEARPSRQCSAFGCRGIGGTLLGQNLDAPAWLDGQQLVSLIRSPLDGAAVVRCGYFGQVFGIGMSGNGFGVVSTTLLNGRGGTTGVPNTVVQAAVLYAPELDAAVDIVRHSPASTATAWILGGDEALFELETTVGGACMRPCQGPCAHTNHARITRDTCDVPGVCAGGTFLMDDGGHSFEGTLERQAALERFFRENDRDALTVRALCGVLRKPPFLRDDRSRTVYTVVMDLTARRLWIYGSAPDAHPMVLDLADLPAPGASV